MLKRKIEDGDQVIPYSRRSVYNDAESGRCTRAMRGSGTKRAAAFYTKAHGACGTLIRVCHVRWGRLSWLIVATIHAGQIGPGFEMPTVSFFPLPPPPPLGLAPD